jgi:hypothetical protein
MRNMRFFRFDAESGCRVTSLAVAFSAAVMACTLLVLAGSSVFAAASGSNIIPTADIYDKGTFSLEYQSENNNRFLAVGGGCDDFALLQFGLTERLEAGVDRYIDDSDTVFNAKYIAARSDKTPVAVGLQDVGHGFKPQLYIIGGIGFDRPLRAHAGAIRLDGSNEAILGMDVTRGDFTFQADYISGHENDAAIGLSWGYRAFVVTYSLVFPNNSGSTGHILNLQYIGRFRR